MPRKPTGMPNGRPKIFKTGEEFEEKAVQYVEFCQQNGQFPNVAGFCVFCDISDDTYFRVRGEFSESFKKVQRLFENAALNSKAVSDTVRIFYMKNKCGYYDKVQADVNVAGTIEEIFSQKKLQF